MWQFFVYNCKTQEFTDKIACAGNSRGHYSEYGRSWFNKMMTRDICFYHITTATSPLPNQVTDEEDDF